MEIGEHDDDGTDDGDHGDYNIDSDQCVCDEDDCDKDDDDDDDFDEDDCDENDCDDGDCDEDGTFLLRPAPW